MSDADDREAIRTLLAEYCFLLDDHHLQAFAQLFTQDGVWSSRNGEAQGPDAIEALLQRLVPAPGPGTTRRHFTTNSVIDLRGDRADVRSYFQVIRDSAQGPAIAVAGRYEDDVIRTASGWRFARRVLHHDIAGESGLLASSSAR